MVSPRFPNTTRTVSGMCRGWCLTCLSRRMGLTCFSALSGPPFPSGCMRRRMPLPARSRRRMGTWSRTSWFSSVRSVSNSPLMASRPPLSSGPREFDASLPEGLSGRSISAAGSVKRRLSGIGRRKPRKGFSPSINRLRPDPSGRHARSRDVRDPVFPPATMDGHDSAYGWMELGLS